MTTTKWTTKTGKAVEYTTTFENGIILRGSTLKIDGIEQICKGQDRIKGMDCVAIIRDSQTVYVAIPAANLAELAQAKKDSNKPLVMTAAEVAEDEKTTRDYLFEREMNSKYSDL